MLLHRVALLIAMGAVVVLVPSCAPNDHVLLSRVSTADDFAYGLAGRAVVYSSGDEIHILNGDKLTRLRLAGDALWTTRNSLVISSDGGRLLYRHRATGPSAVRIPSAGSPIHIAELDLHTGTTKELLRCDGEPLQAMYSPSGRYIAVVVRRSDHSEEICLVDSTSGRSRVIHGCPAGHLALLCWSPKDEHIYCWRQKKGARAQVVRIAREREAPVVVVHSLPEAIHIEHEMALWPNGRNLLYVKESGEITLLSNTGKETSLALISDLRGMLCIPQLSASRRFAAIWYSSFGNPSTGVTGICFLDVTSGRIYRISTTGYPYYSMGGWHPSKDILLVGLTDRVGTELRAYNADELPLR